jgi:SAM-dependent methyltransferase
MDAQKIKSCYWNDVAEQWQQTNRHKVLRSLSDTLNSRLFDSWLSPERVQSLLKTDLFDESLTDGLYPLLAQHAECITGIDISPDIVAAAKKRHPQLEAVETDVRRMPFAPATFDVVVSNSTLDHFESTDDIVTSLQEIKRVLKSNGRLLLTLDNYTNPAIFIRNVLPFQWLHRMGLVPYYVGATFGARGLRQALETLGFKAIEVKPFWHCPRIPLVMMANLVGPRLSMAQKQRIFRVVLSCERFARWPTKYLTGHYIAARAIKA